MSDRWETPRFVLGVEKELASLDIQIARAREALHLNETQLAARAGMNASKISRIENSSQNLTLNTLKRIAECARPESEHRVDPKGKQKGEGRDCGLHTNARAKAGRLKGQEIYASKWWPSALLGSRKRIRGSRRYDQRVDRNTALVFFVHHERVDIDFGQLRPSQDDPAYQCDSLGQSGAIAGWQSSRATQ
jgi:transcriptional regulator with XRE-family HTH domain